MSHFTLERAVSRLGMIEEVELLDINASQLLIKGKKIRRKNHSNASPEEIKEPNNMMEDIFAAVERDPRHLYVENY